MRPQSCQHDICLHLSWYHQKLVQHLQPVWKIVVRCHEDSIEDGNSIAANICKKSTIDMRFLNWNFQIIIWHVQNLTLDWNLFSSWKQVGLFNSIRCLEFIYLHLINISQILMCIFPQFGHLLLPWFVVMSSLRWDHAVFFYCQSRTYLSFKTFHISYSSWMRTWGHSQEINSLGWAICLHQEFCQHGWI